MNNKHGNQTHGRSTSLEYISWASIKQRCTNPNHDAYKNYHDRNIKICQLWEYSFEEFYCDMGPRPSKLHSIERIDNDNGYYPNNCKWGLQEEQENNKRTNRRLVFNGHNLTITQWSKELKVSRHFIFERLKRGWSIEDTLTKSKGYKPLLS